MHSTLFLLAAVLPASLAYPQITSPAGGSDWTTGSVTVEWEDTGSPSISQLSGYTLQLIVGGNDATNSQPIATIVQTGTFSSALKTTGSLNAGVAGATPNGFYLKMTCAATEGGQIVVYSNRFSIPSLTGTTPPQFVQAASALGSSTAGPAVQNNVANNAAPAAGAGAVPAGAGAGVPYNMQSGTIRYAPMQSIPPTKITAKSFTPLYPTSAFTIAKTFLPLASVVSTLTVPQTFSVSSIENPASAQPQPSDDMAKFLARWKD